MDLNLDTFIAEYGNLVYGIIFVWAFLEGETFVIFAGLAAFQGLLSLPLVIACACLGSFGGDQFYFFLGRRYGPRVVARFPRWSSGVKTAMGFLERYNTLFILSFRFVYGIRNVSSFTMGLSSLAWERFFVLNFIAATVWATSFALVGYVFGRALETVLSEVATEFSLGMLGIFLLVAWVAMTVHRRRKRRVVAPPPEAHATTSAEGIKERV